MNCLRCRVVVAVQTFRLQGRLFLSAANFCAREAFCLLGCMSVCLLQESLNVSHGVGGEL